MEIKRKPTAWVLFGGYVVWTGVIQPVWNLNIEKAAEKSRLDTALIDGGAVMDWLHWMAGYVPSSFGLGFVLGALIFAYWDNIVGFVRRRKLGPVKADMRVWIGNMWPHFNYGKRNAELWISILNVGDVPLRLKRLDGVAVINTQAGKFTLADPRFHEKIDDLLERGNFTTFCVRFDSPPKFWDNYPDMFIWRNPRTSMDLEAFSVVMESPTGDEKIVKGWECMRMTSGNEEICSRQTFKLWKSDEEREEFQSAMGAMVKMFGAKL